MQTPAKDPGPDESPRQVILRKRFNQGLEDGRAGRPAADFRRAYLEGYTRGRDGREIVRERDQAGEE